MWLQNALYCQLPNGTTYVAFIFKGLPGASTNIARVYAELLNQIVKLDSLSGIPHWFRLVLYAN